MQIYSHTSLSFRFYFRFFIIIAYHYPIVFFGCLLPLRLFKVFLLQISGLNMTVEEYEVVKGDEEFLLRTWKLAVTQEETLSVKTPDNETFTLTL
jgi:hypothetical protein